MPALYMVGATLRLFVRDIGKINSRAIEGSTSHVTAYGTADFKLNVSGRIKITAYGDAELHYKGNPEINKGLHFGDMVIDKMD